MINGRRERWWTERRREGWNENRQGRELVINGRKKKGWMDGRVEKAASPYH